VRLQVLRHLGVAITGQVDQVAGLLRRDLRGAAGNTLQAVRRELSNAFGDTVSVQTFSGESKQGVDEAREVVGRWLEF
jgi:hypothetical protein